MANKNKKSSSRKPAVVPATRAPLGWMSREHLESAYTDKANDVGFLEADRARLLRDAENLSFLCRKAEENLASAKVSLESERLYSQISHRAVERVNATNLALEENQRELIRQRESAEKALVSKDHLLRRSIAELDQANAGFDRLAKTLDEQADRESTRTVYLRRWWAVPLVGLWMVLGVLVAWPVATLAFISELLAPPNALYDWFCSCVDVLFVAPLDYALETKTLVVREAP